MKLLKEMIKEKYTSTKQIMVEKVLQCEFEEQLGYEKHLCRNNGSKNCQNG